MISLHQLDSRNFRLPDKRVLYSSVRFDENDDPYKDRSEHSYSYFRITIAKLNENEHSDVPTSTFTSKRINNNLNSNMQEGKISICLNTDFFDKDPVFTFIDCKLSSEKNIDFIFEDMDEGEYVVIVDPIWFFDVGNRFNVSVHSVQQSEVYLLQNSSEEMFAEIQSQIWNDYVCQNKTDLVNIQIDDCLESYIKR